MKETDIAAQVADALHSVSDHLLMHSTNPWELDAAMTGFGFRTGVCTSMDETGLDLILPRLHAGGFHGTPVLSRMVAEGRLGRKLGVGWYRYPGGGGLVIDPLVEDLLREEARFAGVTRVDLPDDVLVERIVTGIAQVLSSKRPEISQPEWATIDTVSIEVLGFPVLEGGFRRFAGASASRLSGGLRRQP